MKSKMLWWGMLLILLIVSGSFLLAFFLPSLSPQERTILFVPKTVGNQTEFWEVLSEGVFTAAAEFHAHVEVSGTLLESDIEGQIEVLEQVLQRREKPDAIVLAATDYHELVPVSEKLMEAGIELVLVDSELNKPLASSLIATNNYAAGQKAGREIMQHLEPNGKVALVSFVKKAASAIDREAGTRDYLSQYPELTVLETIYSDGEEDIAYNMVRELLRQHPDVTGIVGLNEPSGVGAAKAVRDSGMAGQVKLVCFDNSTDEIMLMEEGIIQALIVQKPFNMGYLAIKTAIDVLDGKRVEERIDTGSVVITKDNMYFDENQKLLFPFVEK